ncbi:MAG TPA: nuclear transport factor 2 family protein [Pyrinomonadaceae bacterium]|nr:nuclear transport factor 2 family protein [Pyrinomonadaceae bacterium]
MKTKFTVLILILTAVGSIAAQTEKNDAEVRAALKAYDTAWNSKNVDGARKVMHENYVYFNSLGGSPRDRENALTFLGKPDYKLTFVERAEIEVFRTGETAVVSSRWIGKGSWSGGEINDDQRCGLVFVRDKKAWKLISEHCVQIASK